MCAQIDFIQSDYNSKNVQHKLNKVITVGYIEASRSQFAIDLVEMK